jgi:hypothetical protein
MQIGDGEGGRRTHAAPWLQRSRVTARRSTPGPGRDSATFLCATTNGASSAAAAETASVTARRRGRSDRGVAMGELGRVGQMGR